MKFFIKLSIVALALAALESNAAMEGYYVQGEAGPAFLQDNTITSSGNTESFDPGIRADVSVGRHLNDQFSVEFETGIIWNRLDSINGFSVSPRTIDFYQFPFLINGIYNIPAGKNWKPYVGIGLGGVATSVNATQPTYQATDFTFAYQAQLGIKYSLTPNTHLDFGYKFLGSLDHSFTDGGTTKTSPFYTHAVLVSFTWDF